MTQKPIVLFLIASACLAGPIYVDGILIEQNTARPIMGKPLDVIDSFPSSALNSSSGLAFDGLYLWNDAAWIHWFARLDTATGSVVNSFAPTVGNRDMVFDGEYLWASDWATGSISQYDTSDCSIIATYYPPFYAGKPNGMAWDGTHLWVGEEAGRIYQMTTSGDTVRSIPSPLYYSYEPRGLAFDGEYLWVGYQALDRIYKIDTINGAVQVHYTAPGASTGAQQGLAFDGQYLWSTNGYGKWIYKIDIGFTGIEETEIGEPVQLALSSRPNPFVTRTELKFTISETAPVRLSVVDVLGRVIIKPFDQTLAPGTYSITLQHNDLQAGVFYALLESQGQFARIKMVVLDR